jgi:hypothetical protein
LSVVGRKQKSFRKERMTLVDFRSDTILENKEKTENTEKQRRRRGRTQEKIKDYIVADYTSCSDYKIV